MTPPSGVTCTPPLLINPSSSTVTPYAITFPFKNSSGLTIPLRCWPGMLMSTRSVLFTSQMTINRWAKPPMFGGNFWPIKTPTISRLSPLSIGRKATVVLPITHCWIQTPIQSSKFSMSSTPSTYFWKNSSTPRRWKPPTPDFTFKARICSITSFGAQPSSLELRDLKLASLNSLVSLSVLIAFFVGRRRLLDSALPEAEIGLVLLRYWPWSV